MVSKDEDFVIVTVTNQGTHLASNIQVVAFPQDHSPTSLPSVHESQASTVRLRRPLGALFAADIEQLNPRSGWAICKLTFGARDVSVFGVDVTWNDHDGKQRKSQGTADLTTVNIITEIKLTPIVEQQ